MKKNKKIFQIGDEGDLYQWKVASLIRWGKNGINAGGFRDQDIKQDNGKSPECLVSDAPRHIPVRNDDREVPNFHLSRQQSSESADNGEVTGGEGSEKKNDYIRTYGRDPLSVLPEMPPKFLTRGIRKDSEQE